MTKNYVPFFLALLLIALGWIFVTTSTWNAQTYDGVRLYGFPLPFYAEGGQMLARTLGSSGSDEGVKPTIDYLNLCIDIVITIALPLMVQKLWAIIRRLKVHQ